MMAGRYCSLTFRRYEPDTPSAHRSDPFAMQRSSGSRLLKEPGRRTYDGTDMLFGDGGLHA